MKNKIFAVVVLYNPDMEIVESQYNSLYDQVNHIVYVDNGSSNIKELEEKFFEKIQDRGKLTLIKNKENMGLGFAHNQGISYSKKENADYVLILDHDSVLKDGFTKSLLASYLSSSETKIGAIGPIYINEETKEIYPITKYIGPFIKRIIPKTNLVEASCLISSGSLIPIKVLDAVGCMNEDLFVDYIDIDWSYRARNKGYKLYANPNAVMNHKIGDKRISVFGRKISMHSPLRRYYLTRNSIYMLTRPYISFGYKLRETVFNTARIIVFTILSNDRKSYLKYSLRGLLDGLRGRYGKCSLLK